MTMEQCGDDVMTVIPLGGSSLHAYVALARSTSSKELHRKEARDCADCFVHALGCADHTATASPSPVAVRM